MKVKELLSDKSKWTKGAMWRVEGGRIGIDAGVSCSYCLLGALEKCYYRSASQDSWFSLLNKIVHEINPSGDINNCTLRYSIFIWNDRPERTFEEVKALVEKLDI